jgi:hypothetical protein
VLFAHLYREEGHRVYACVVGQSFVSTVVRKKEQDKFNLPALPMYCPTEMLSCLSNARPRILLSSFCSSMAKAVSTLVGSFILGVAKAVRHERGN